MRAAFGATPKGAVHCESRMCSGRTAIGACRTVFDKIRAHPSEGLGRSKKNPAGVSPRGSRLYQSGGEN
jgi:hypothetical protein